MILFNLLLSVNYIAGPEDRMAYDLPATVAYCLLLGVAVWGVLGALPAGSLAAGITILALVPAWNAARNLDECNLRTERTARTYVEEILEDVPEGSVVVTSEWNFYAPYLYMRYVEGFRPDVRVIDALMLRRFWYLRHLERSMPELIAASRPEFEAYREQIDRFDLGLSYDQLRIQSIYDALMRRWVELGREAGGAFVDWASLEKPQEQSWIRTFPSLPQGLLLRFVEDPQEEASPIAARNAENLRYVRSKLTARAVRGEATDPDLIPRHDPYRKVWSSYLRAVEASLLLAALRGGDAGLAARAREYGRWFPEIELAVEHTRQRGGR
jgi:hypothetical protein